MKIQIDLKSALLGLVVGVVAVFCMGAQQAGGPIGRYQIATGITGTGGYAIILDTATGKAWGRVRDYAHDGNFFEPK